MIALCGFVCRSHLVHLWQVKQLICSYLFLFPFWALKVETSSLFAHQHGCRVTLRLVKFGSTSSTCYVHLNTLCWNSGSSDLLKIWSDSGWQSLAWNATALWMCATYILASVFSVDGRGGDAAGVSFCKHVGHFYWLKLWIYLHSTLLGIASVPT